MSVDPQGLAAEDADFVTGHWYPDPAFCIACAPGLVGFDTHDVASSSSTTLASPLRQLPAGAGRRPARRAAVTSSATASRTSRPAAGRRRRSAPFTRYFAPAQLVRAGGSVADEFIKVSANPRRARAEPASATRAGRCSWATRSSRSTRSSRTGSVAASRTPTGSTRRRRSRLHRVRSVAARAGPAGADAPRHPLSARAG